MNKSNLILASVSAIIFTSILIIFSPNSQKLNFSSSVPSPTSSQSISPTPSPISTESISPTPDPTADWKTYINTQYLYSLKYPNGWLTRSFGPGSNGLQPLNSSSRGVILSPNNQETTVPSPMFEIQAEGPENLSRPIYSEWEKQIKTNFINSFKLTKELISTISGVTATILEGEHVYPKTSTYIKQFIFASSEKGVYFTIAISSDTKQESLVFDQILSTFKFTDTKTNSNKYDGCYESKNAIIKIETTTSGSTVLEGNATWENGFQDDRFTVHEGTIDGILDISDNKAHFNKDGCDIDFEFSQKTVVAKEREGSVCGGINVTFDGEYNLSNIDSPPCSSF